MKPPLLFSPPLRKIPVIATALAGFLLLSCNEDPALLKKHGEQEVEIAKLRGELALIQEQLKQAPSDKSAELATARTEAKKLAQEHETLTAEVAELDAKLEQIKADYEDYKRKYAVK